jgi:parallel beta-helix repeat protein
MNAKRFPFASTLAALAALPFVYGGAAFACTTTVTAPASIQAAVDAASPGDTICLSGTFHQSVVISSAQSGITLQPVSAGAAVLDGTAPADAGTTLLVDAIRLGNGVSGLTILGLEMRNYVSGTCCGQGNGIQAWDVNTSSISVLDNNIHDNSWDAVLVGSDGNNFAASGWVVDGNTAANNLAYGIEFTNCSGCSAQGNTVSGPATETTGFLIQARNTIPDSGTVAVHGVSLKNNQVSGTAIGLYILALASDESFNAISGAYSQLQSVSVVNDGINSGLGALVWGFNFFATDHSLIGPAQVTNPAIANDTLNCGGSGPGIWLVNANTVNAKVVHDTFSECATTLTDSGDATKNPLPSSPTE